MKAIPIILPLSHLLRGIGDSFAMQSMMVSSRWLQTQCHSDFLLIKALKRSISSVEPFTYGPSLRRTERREERLGLMIHKTRIWELANQKYWT